MSAVSAGNNAQEQAGRRWKWCHQNSVPCIQIIKLFIISNETCASGEIAVCYILNNNCFLQSSGGGLSGSSQTAWVSGLGNIN